MGRNSRNTHKLKYTYICLCKPCTVLGLKWKVLLKNNGVVHERRFCERKNRKSAQGPFCRGTSWPTKRVGSLGNCVILETATPSL